MEHGMVATRRGRAFSLALAVLLGCTLPASAEDILVHELRLRDGQHGFAGETGTLWVIEPSGAFRVARFVNRQESLERQGQLDADERAELAASLAANDLAGLPPSLGEPATNARTIDLAYGAERVVLVMPPQATDLESLTERSSDDERQARLLAIVAKVLDVTAD